MLTVKQLQNILKDCPDDMEIINEQNTGVVRIAKKDNMLIVSTENHKRAGEYVYPPVEDMYRTNIYR